MMIQALSLRIKIRKKKKVDEKPRMRMNWWYWWTWYHHIITSNHHLLINHRYSTHFPMSHQVLCWSFRPGCYEANFVLLQNIFWSGRSLVGNEELPTWLRFAGHLNVLRRLDHVRPSYTSLHILVDKSTPYHHEGIGAILPSGWISLAPSSPSTRSHPPCPQEPSWT